MRALVVYAATLTGLMLCFCASPIRGIWLEGPLWQLAILAAVALVAERRPVRITPNPEITFTYCRCCSQRGLRALDAMAVGALGLLVDFRPPHVRWLIWTAMRTLAGGLAGLAVIALLPIEPTVGELILAVVAAALIEALVDSGLGAVTVALHGLARRKRSCARFSRFSFRVWPFMFPRSSSSHTRMGRPRNGPYCCSSRQVSRRRACTGSIGNSAKPPRSWQLQTSGCRVPTCRLPRLSWQHLMREIAIQRVTPPLSPYTRGTSQTGWDYRRSNSNWLTFADLCMTWEDAVPSRTPRKAWRANA